MINATYIAIIGIIILVLFRKKANIAWIGMLFLLVYAILALVPMTVIEKIPFMGTNTEGIIYVNGGSFELNSGVTAMISSDYVITEETTEDDLEKWLDMQNKNVYIYIKSGDNINYSYNLGLVDKRNMEETIDIIMDLYTKWVNKDGLPVTSTKLWLGSENIGIYLER